MIVILDKIKRRILNFILPKGSITHIRRGHLKGFKIVISENSGWSPVVGRWEPVTQNLFKRLIKKDQIVFDLGANNGIHTLLFSTLVGEKGKVLAFEPLQENIKELVKNCSLNQIRNVEIVPYAVGKDVGKVVFKLGLHNKQGSLVGIGRESGQKIEVNLTTLESFISDRKIVPDFIKMDIEGAESDALTGIQNLMSDIKPLFFIELHTPEQDLKVGELLLNWGYEAYRLIENRSAGKLLQKVKDLKTSRSADGIWGNILAIHPSKIGIIKSLI